MTTTYFKLTPAQIVQSIIKASTDRTMLIKGMEFTVCPHVYPSDRFRSSLYILDVIEPLVKDKVVCDMGCGMGLIGQFALLKGAKRVVQADINPFAVKNAKSNKKLHKIPNSDLSIYRSDCFTRVPKQVFDIIIFNIPFHSEDKEIKDPLELAFHDPQFRTVEKFLKQAKRYSDGGTQILIAFSNKGDVKALETKFDASGLEWCLWKITNTDQQYDTRIYSLKM